MDRQYDVVVIGSGCGGSAAAALASYRGLKTLLIEKNKFFGGRAATVEIEGFRMDHGHMIGRCRRGPHGDLLRIVKCADLMPKYKTFAQLKFLANVFGYSWDFTGNAVEAIKSFMFSVFPDLMRSEYFSIFDTPGITRLFLQFVLLGEKRIRELDQVDLKTFLSKYTNDKFVQYMFGGLSAVAFGVLADDTSAGEFIRTIQGMLNAGIGIFGYPVTGEGVSAIPNSFLRAAARYGADIEARTPAERIVVEDNQAKGVYVKGELIESAIVISNTGIKETSYKLVGKEHYERKFIDYLDGLKYCYGGISLKYALDKPIIKFDVGTKMPVDFDRNMHDALNGRVPDEISIMAVCTSNIDPRLAPPGRQILVAISPGPPVEPGKIDWGPWVANFKRQIEEDLVPGISKHTLFCVESTPDVIAGENSRFTGDAIGVAQSMDQVGDKTPPSISPIKGLYHVGADVGSKGIATEMATQSAIDLFEELDRKGLPAGRPGSSRWKL